MNYSAQRSARSPLLQAERRVPRAASLAALTGLAILLQPLVAGQFVGRNGRGSWVGVHPVSAGVVLAPERVQ